MKSLKCGTLLLSCQEVGERECTALVVYGRIELFVLVQKGLGEMNIEL